MEMGLGACGMTQDIESATFPQLRLLTAPVILKYTPEETLPCQWLECTPKSAAESGHWNGFSAAGYIFGRELHQALKIPIGLIVAACGATVCEQWTSAEALAPLGDFNDRLAEVARHAAAVRAGKPAGEGPSKEGTPLDHVCTLLYNGMIAPLAPYAIKGVAWYQGEHNTDRGYQYRKLLPAMIADWRSRFGVGDFPFYIVQLPNFQQVAADPRDHDWAELREAQALTAKNVPNCGLAVTIDIGDGTPHPRNKTDVGRRLALCALAQTYGKKIGFSGPWYRGMKSEDSSIRLSFDHVGGGLVAKGDQLTGLAVAGEDRKFVWADAKIVGDAIVVSSDKIAHPVAARYAWDGNPPCNLYNKDGLPAVPFRTDTWPGITDGNK